MTTTKVPTILATGAASRRSFIHANAAPRCQHVKLNGEPCGCPARQGQSLCHFHEGARLMRHFEIPLPEDAASVQLAIHRVMRAMYEGTFDIKTCNGMLYALQVASGNLPRLREEMAGVLSEGFSGEEEEESPLAELMRQLDITEDERKADERKGGVGS